VKLLLDEHISGKVAGRLRGLGHDVVAVADLWKMRSRRDADVFESAQREGRAVVTYDREDFEQLVRRCIRANRPHHGLVIVLSARIHSGEFARLTAALAALLDGPDLGPSFVVWLQPADARDLPSSP
jgi:predicted nuclease of predicted toxin-antitoxin system